MDQALSAYNVITVSSEYREIERLRAKARHDEAQALYHAEQKGIEKGRQEEKLEMARKLKSMGLPAHQISQVSGLSCSEIDDL